MPVVTLNIIPKLEPIYTIINKNDRSLCKYEYINLVGGRGVGKSEGMAQLFVLISRVEKTRLLCTREIQNTMRDSVHRMIVEWIYYLKIEYELVKNFFREGDSVSGLKYFRDKLREIHALSYKLFEFYNNQDSDQPLQIKKTMRYLEDTHFIRIRKNYFLFLIDVVRNYFETNIQLVQEKIGNMIDQMWGD